MAYAKLYLTQLQSPSLMFDWLPPLSPPTGSILVNPWNINDVAAAIEDALTMSEEERRERHRQNYMHVATHTAQTWADTFISELNDTHIEADLRLRHTPPELDFAEVRMAG